MSPTPRSLILDLLSTLRSGSMPVRALVQAGALFGLDGNAVRVALARLCAAGQVESLQRGHYRLGAGAEAIQREVVAWRGSRRATRRWDGAWIAMLPPGAKGGRERDARGRGLAQPGRARHERALRLAGLRPLTAGLSVRPDNLEAGLQGARARLLALGIWPGSAVFRALDLGPELEARARDLWPIRELRVAYRRSRQMLVLSRKRLAHADREEAMVESFLLGGRVIRQLVLDPLLPEEILDPAGYRALVREMREYDRFGRRCWADFMREWGVLGSRAPAHGPASDWLGHPPAAGGRA
ncbi:MAG: PaaX family transcriptional regulator [Myxococcota bacterium]